MSPMRCASLELLSAIDCPLLTLVGCPPAHLAHQNVTLAPTPMNHERSRLQGKAGKAVDIVTLSRLWKHASSNARETIQPVVGPSTGLLWSDCSRDERSGWLQGPSFPASLSQPKSACRESRREASVHWHHKLEHKRGSCAEFRSTASADTPMSLAGQQAHGHVCTTRSATVLPTFAAKRA